MRIKTTQLKQIPVPGGDVYHVIRSDSEGFKGFGEVYLSFIKSGEFKDWKLHNEMTLNLVVPIGNVCFKFKDENSLITEITIGESNYQRLTVEPKTWFCFENKGTKNAMVINVSDICHDENEVVRKQ
jgi:dTDP-4-dehydrorhamnose 3,5-epimerase